MKTVLTTLALVLTCSIGVLAAQKPTAADRSKLDHFEAKIRPVLVEHCYGCHSVEAGKAKGGLRLDSGDGWRVGGDSGPAIIPGKPDESLIIAAISHSGEISEMPPKSRLSEQVVNDFRKWISDGALDPRQGKHRQKTARQWTSTPAGRSGPFSLGERPTTNIRSMNS